MVIPQSKYSYIPFITINVTFLQNAEFYTAERGHLGYAQELLNHAEFCTAECRHLGYAQVLIHAEFCTDERGHLGYAQELNQVDTSMFNASFLA